jgi:hypothetical protein
MHLKIKIDTYPTNNNKNIYRLSNLSAVFAKTSSIDVSWVVGHTFTISYVLTSYFITLEVTSFVVAIAN